ncbi:MULTISPECIES: DUF4236 domain-containing protein [unclassified Pseudomonas]|uniref:DUF4236 domain-containing protein n=1 Tax=unclassified Pseudomonas TaxID=196821 RepID=UPI001297E705|nr:MULTISPECIES: DUF4236 domain-containing protein [unclassified Pseudomonas]MQU09737.1 DUF4236 domain-containing protein [Pseudomonas sp. FSL R10-2189]MQU36183.1 DUF4236 domain-containing protein [Pseudomonas sp. FSL R10-2172]
MGFRFSKRVTIVPGVRLNISAKGVSTSIGPRGLSMTMGRNGTFLNAGLPGTGLSYRHRLDGGRQGCSTPAFDSDDYSGSIKIKVEDDGTLLITDEDGNDLPPALVRRAKTEQAEAIQQLLEKAAEKVNQELEACLGVYMATPGPGASPKLPPAFAEEQPVMAAAPSSGMMERLFRGKEIEAERLRLELQYQQDLADWTAARDAQETLINETRKAFRLAAQGFSAQMEKALDYVLSDIAWPKETIVDYEFTHDVTGVALDVDLPDEDDIPRRTAEAKGNGKLSFKNRTDAQVRRDFVGLCYGSLFRVVGEVFALLPAIDKCLVSGYLQRPNPANGKVDEPYILSVLVTRAEWETLDFARLEDIDPAATLNSFGAVVSLDRSSRFREIEPHGIAALG